jgi:DNA-binding XRE family transcriptional regulator
VELLLSTGIKMARAQVGMSQVELAHATGQVPSYISSIETGNADPRWSLVLALCAAMRIELSELVAFAGAAAAAQAKTTTVALLPGERIDLRPIGGGR